MKKLLGKLVCWWRGHHIDGHKRKATVSERVLRSDIVTKYVYQCSRCGRLKDAPYPVKRKKEK